MQPLSPPPPLLPPSPPIPQTLPTAQRGTCKNAEQSEMTWNDLQLARIDLKSPKTSKQVRYNLQ